MGTKKVEKLHYLEAGGAELPCLDSIQSGHGNTTGDEAITAGNSNSLEWTLDTVENVVENTWSQLDGQRLQTQQQANSQRQ